MKTIAISQRIDEFPERSERRDALDQALVRFVVECGYIPVVIPNAMVNTTTVDFSDNGAGIASLLSPVVSGGLESLLKQVQPQGIVLSGGNDVGTCLDRDITEAVLIRYAVRNNIPLLGVCRGMQMLGVYMGATLKRINGHVRTRHQLKGVYNHEVNSYHNQTLTDLTSDFDITAISDDNAVEGMRHSKLDLHGWMWHPEREKPFNQLDIHNFREIFR